MEISTRKSSIDMTEPKSKSVVSCRNTTKKYHMDANKSHIFKENQRMLGKLI